jgi:hemoglobin
MTQDHDPSKVHALPLAEAGGASSGDEALIRRLVDAFYAIAQRDELLGPVFAARVADWGKHLPTMRDFWSTVVFRTGRYAGRPFEKHEAIAELTPAHFERWLTLWRAAVREHAPTPMHESFIEPAERMARSMSERLLRRSA